MNTKYRVTDSHRSWYIYLSYGFKRLSKAVQFQTLSCLLAVSVLREQALMRCLTVSAHADRNALLQSAVLATVTVDPQDGALLVLGAGAVLYLLLDAASEEPL
jgi:hypothetical protein